MSDTTDPGWTERDQHLERLFVFGGFTEAMSFMLRVSYECERMDHHPEWKNIYNKVWVSLSTHSAGNKVTDKDRALAKKMDEIYKAIPQKRAA